jgi:hypothetical protein
MCEVDNCNCGGAPLEPYHAIKPNSLRDDSLLLPAAAAR